VANIKITIAGAKHTPEWETLQNAIIQATGQQGKLTRINKLYGCDYRSPGIYELDFTPDRGDLIRVDFEVSESSR